MARRRHQTRLARTIASLNILLTSTCWRNDHNGFSHRGLGLIDVMLSKHGTVARIYLKGNLIDEISLCITESSSQPNRAMFPTYSGRVPQDTTSASW